MKKRMQKAGNSQCSKNGKIEKWCNEKYVIYLHTSNSKAKIFSSLHGVAMFKIISKNIDFKL